MTEAEWFAETDFTRLASYTERLLWAQSPTRKLRLLALALCRATGMVAVHPDLGPAADTIERYADGRADPNEVGKACLACRVVAVRTHEDFIRAHAEAVTHEGEELRRLSNLAWAVAFAGNTPVPLGRIADNIQDAAERQVIDAQVVYTSTPPELWPRLLAVFREVLGNPFNPVALQPEWRTSTAVALANQVYESRDFSAMPILADALQDAGCENEEVLNHCRNPGTHVRGCWVLDGVLEKR